MSNHAWCSNPARDEAVRATEDGRHGPLPTLEEAIADPFTKTARICETESAVEPVIPAADAQGGGGSGLRTERVTLEVKHACKYPAAEWVLDLVQEACSDPGESVRVVEEVRLPPTIIRLTDEREAARRERDEAREECERLRAERDDALLVLPACCGRLSDAAATVVQERDHANARVAELENAAKLAPGANAGGEAKQKPVAWGVMIDSGRGLYGHYDFESEARGVCDAVNAEEGWSMTVVPLYAAPVAKSATTPQATRWWLTDGERRAIEEGAYALVNDGYYGARAKSELLRALLARPTPPRVKRPKYFPMSWAHERDDAWIAAIREAGGEVD